MSGQTLTTASTLMCPHGGTVSILSSNFRVMIDGVPAALANDVYTIAGCPFQIPAAPSPIPSPCVSVQWVKSDLKTKADVNATLSTTSIGLCLAATQVPQGKVVVQTTQPKVSTS
ncbi:MAG: hypothetical protein HWE13_02660 [Gammaproteobacteria bacterium]|nr:hypothetical protein [Gammaproteobacteria bacterium]